MNSRLQNLQLSLHKPMKVQALKSFAGIISMSEGDVREISDVSLCNDLIDAKLVKKAEEKKPKTTRTKRSAKK